MHAFFNSDIYPPVKFFWGQTTCIDDLLLQEVIFKVNELGACHVCVEVEIFDVRGKETCSCGGDD